MWGWGRLKRDQMVTVIGSVCHTEQIREAEAKKSQNLKIWGREIEVTVMVSPSQMMWEAAVWNGEAVKPQYRGR